MAANLNGTSQKWHLKTFIIGFLKHYQHPANKPTPTIRHKLEKLDFKMYGNACGNALKLW